MVFLRWLLVGFLLSTIPYSANAAGKNVLLIVADDLGLQVGCYGDKVAKTPNLDAFAASGTRFTHAFASVASCSPSRASLLTGMPTHQSGQYGLAHATHNFNSFKATKSIPSWLQPAGFRTGVVAKLHVLPKEVYPFDAEIADGGRNPVQVTEKAKKFIQDAGDKPFFLLVGLTDPHRAAKGFANEGKYPADVPKVKFDPKKVPVPGFLPDTPEVREDLADYYQSVVRLDDGVGRLLKMLEELKKSDDTLVIFLSDNGIPFPGAKTTLYDSGVNLPLIIRKPGGKAGQVTSAMASWTDIAPTVLEWAGVPIPKKLPGRSLLPVLGNPDAAGWDTVYGSHQFHEVTMYYPMRMVRTRTHKLILNLASGLEYPSASDLWGSPTWQAVLSQDLKMLGQRSRGNFLNRAKEELFEVQADPLETKNLVSDPKQADVLKALREKLETWREATNDPWLIKNKHE
jgi:N-sulfoglucosamine sulfohydrolase